MATQAAPYIDMTSGKSWTLGAGDPSTNPNTGKGWASEEEYKAWKSGQGWSDDRTSGYSFGGKNSSYWKDPSTGRVYFGTDTTGALDGKSGYANVGGYIDPSTGKITYGTEGDIYSQFAVDKMGDWGKMGVSSPTESKLFNYGQDYGLGGAYKGIVPLDTDEYGNPVGGYGTGTRGGGFQVFDTLEEAVAARDDYINWYDEKNPQGTPSSMIAPATPGGSAPQTSVTPGLLTAPGANETFYDKTKDLYTDPTLASETFKKDFSQPPLAVQNYNAQSGRFNQPTESEALYDQYKDMLGNAGYLDDFYDRERQKADTALAARASAGGWGGSGTWARATGNLGQEFADKALLARENFIKTGMGAAGQADQSVDTRLGTSNTMATSADKSLYDKLVAAGVVDKGTLDRLNAGTSASSVAQSHMEGREKGALDSSVEIAKDMSNLAMQGFSNAQAQQFASDMQELSLKVQGGKLTADQAYAQSQELLQNMGIVANSVLNAYINNKIGKK